jgi:hypothetical protein
MESSEYWRDLRRKSGLEGEGDRGKDLAGGLCRSRGWGRGRGGTGPVGEIFVRTWRGLFCSEDDRHFLLTVSGLSDDTVDEFIITSHMQTFSVVQNI